MKRETTILKMDNIDNKCIEEAREYLAEQSKKVQIAFNDVLTKGIENYLGRPVDLKLDADRFLSQQYEDGSIEYFVDGNLIGTMTTTGGLYYDDFVNDKFSFSITFTPNIKP